LRRGLEAYFFFDFRFAFFAFFAFFAMSISNGLRKRIEIIQMAGASPKSLIGSTQLNEELFCEHLGIAECCGYFSKYGLAPK
jgi:hypothetical protein